MVKSDFVRTKKPSSEDDNPANGSSTLFVLRGRGVLSHFPSLALMAVVFVYTYFTSSARFQAAYLANYSTTSETTRNMTAHNLNKTTAVTPRRDDEYALPTCRSLMENPHSPYRDGSFLTRRNIGVSWHPRVDGSRELRHSICRLQRYTAEDAHQCLANRHVNWIGDSLTRYQYLSMAWFLHKGAYPPRFGRHGECHFFDEDNRTACSSFEEPNVATERDWNGAKPADMGGRGDAWTNFMKTLGGPLYFDGYMESNSVRRAATFKDENIVENYFYASPPKRQEDGDERRVFLSYNSELGWHANPLNIHGFTYTGCAFSGTCNYTNDLAKQRIERATRLDFDFSQPLETAIGPNGVLRQVLPPVNISLYNRGLWGVVDKEKANRIMPLLHDFSQGSKGRCYFRSSTGRFEGIRQHELQVMMEATAKAGCGFIDVGHLLEDFNTLRYLHPGPPGQEYGNIKIERDTIYWDSVHFNPWVYEELNNMLLNVLCNNS